MKIEIDTTDRSLANDLSGGQYDSENPTAVEIPGGVSLQIEHLIKRYTADIPETIVAILNLGKDVTVGVVAAWLYNKLKGRATTLKIDETEVQIDKGEIEKVIHRKIEKKE